MKIASALNFGLAALNVGMMIYSAMNGGWAWIVCLASAVFCFCMGLVTLR